MSTAAAHENTVVVIGGGIAGLTAALRAAELGLCAIVLEQGSGPRYPCNTRFSGGILHVAFHDVQRPAEELRDIVRKATRDTASPPLADAVATDGRRLLAWLRAHDVRFMRFSTLEQHRWGMAPPRPVGPGMDWEGRGPDAMLRTLTDHLRRAGGEIVLNARANSLLMEGSRCAGVRGEHNGANRTWPATAVVIADGGFQANPDMFRRYIGPTPERMLQRGAANGRGDGVLMAVAAGAAAQGMSKFYGHLQIRDALTDARVWPYPELDSVAVASLVVGPDGRRVADEGLGGISMSNALARLQDPAGATLICTAAIWDSAGKAGRLPANPFLERFGGRLIRADSLGDLASQSAIAAAPLAATVAEYNAALSGSRLDALVPPRSVGKIAPMPIDAAPYIAIPLCVGITYTTGGILVDGHGAVLRADNSTIPGLYAAGATIAGLDGGGDDAYVSYVGGLIKAVFGLRAAEHIAEHASTPASAGPASR